MKLVGQTLSMIYGLFFFLKSLLLYSVYRYLENIWAVSVTLATQFLLKLSTLI